MVELFYELTEQHPNFKMFLPQAAQQNPSIETRYKSIESKTTSISEGTLQKHVQLPHYNRQLSSNKEVCGKTHNYELSKSQKVVTPAKTDVNNCLIIQDSGFRGNDRKTQTAIFCKTINNKWQNIHIELRNEIKVRHYSPKTLKSYAMWVRKLRSFSQNKDPDVLSTSDVKNFLTFLGLWPPIF